MTDQMQSYHGLSKEFASHGTMDHSAGEYVRGIVHVNFSESYFSLFKRGIIGAFHHISRKHIQRYLEEFDYADRLIRDDPVDTKRTGEGEAVQPFLPILEIERWQKTRKPKKKRRRRRRRRKPPAGER